MKSLKINKAFFEAYFKYRKLETGPASIRTYLKYCKFEEKPFETSHRGRTHKFF